MASRHTRNTLPMLTSPRCGARTRSGAPCRSPAVKGKLRCRMHGGSKGSGARPGNANAHRHGGYTREALARRAELRRLIRITRQLLKERET
jgi:glucans biosynthesis protein